MISYGFVKELEISFDETVTKVTEALKKEEFSVLTTIDVQQKFREKLGIDFQRYLILGACNPTFAQNGKTVLAVMKPTLAMKMISKPELANIAQTVEAKFKSVFDSV
jgi:uncharacterized protein (DUF302 family)